MPLALSRYLDQLVASSDEEDVPTTRKELVAAITLGASADGGQLQQLLRDYRATRVSDLARKTDVATLLPGRGEIWPPAEEDPTPAARLCRTPQARVGLSLPGPISARLDALLDGVRAVGETTTRQELLAALICAVPQAELAEAVLVYRRARVQDAMINGEDPDRFLNPTPPPRGPRPRKAKSHRKTPPDRRSRDEKAASGQDPLI